MVERGSDGIGVWRAKGRGRWRQEEGDIDVSFRGWVVLCSGRGGGEERVRKAPENCLHLIFLPTVTSLLLVQKSFSIHLYFTPALKIEKRGKGFWSMFYTETNA